MAGGDAVFGARRAHADDFLGAEIGADEGQSADPGGERAAGLEEVFAGLHVALEGKADAQHKHEVEQHDDPVDGCEIGMGQSEGLRGARQSCAEDNFTQRRGSKSS